MNKKIVFVLIFFLAFITQLRTASALGTSQCRFFDLSTGECVHGKIFDYRDYEVVEEIAKAPEETMREIIIPTTEFQTQVLTLAFQFFGIVILFILLMVMVEELIRGGK